MWLDGYYIFTIHWSALVALGCLLFVVIMSIILTRGNHASNVD